METRDSDVAEVISEHHLLFMRDFVAREEKLAKATIERFLRGRKPRRDASTLNK